MIGFTLWGGNIISVGEYNYPADFDYLGSHEITLTLRIEATAGTVVSAGRRFATGES